MTLSQKQRLKERLASQQERTNYQNMALKQENQNKLDQAATRLYQQNQTRLNHTNLDGTFNQPQGPPLHPNDKIDEIDEMKKPKLYKNKKFDNKIEQIRRQTLRDEDGHLDTKRIFESNRKVLKKPPIMIFEDYERPEMEESVKTVKKIPKKKRHRAKDPDFPLPLEQPKQYLPMPYNNNNMNGEDKKRFKQLEGQLSKQSDILGKMLTEFQNQRKAANSENRYQKSPEQQLLNIEMKFDTIEKHQEALRRISEVKDQMKNEQNKAAVNRFGGEYHKNNVQEALREMKMKYDQEAALERERYKNQNTRNLPMNNHQNNNYNNRGPRVIYQQASQSSEEEDNESEEDSTPKYSAEEVKKLVDKMLKEQLKPAMDRKNMLINEAKENARNQLINKASNQPIPQPQVVNMGGGNQTEETEEDGDNYDSLSELQSQKTHKNKKSKNSKNGQNDQNYAHPHYHHINNGNPYQGGGNGPMDQMMQNMLMMKMLKNLQQKKEEKSVVEEEEPEQQYIFLDPENERESKSERRRRKKRKRRMKEKRRKRKNEKYQNDNFGGVDEPLLPMPKMNRPATVISQASTVRGYEPINRFRPPNLDSLNSNPVLMSTQKKIFFNPLDKLPRPPSPEPEIIIQKQQIPMPYPMYNGPQKDNGDESTKDDNAAIKPDKKPIKSDNVKPLSDEYKRYKNHSKSFIFHIFSYLTFQSG